LTTKGLAGAVHRVILSYAGELVTIGTGTGIQYSPENRGQEMKIANFLSNIK
jgi:hypothetical protein